MNAATAFLIIAGAAAFVIWCVADYIHDVRWWREHDQETD
jgi:hypothetical protein